MNAARRRLILSDKTDNSCENAVIALWNAAYNAGTGVGAIGMGLVAGSLGYPVTFLVTAAAVLAALFLAGRKQGKTP